MAVHHFSVDVEEYFHVSAFEPFVPYGTWDGFESRVSASVNRLLELLARSQSHATFFMLGWLAERQPALVHRIAAAGHEIASHGWDHARVTQQTPLAFRDSIRRTKIVLEDLAGTPVLGFRAPSFSILPGYEWALDVLLEEGYRYDSSLFPVRRNGYGYANGHRDPHWLDRPAGRLAEVPPATLRRWGAQVPAGGGAYFRLFPYAVVKMALRDCERRGVPGTFYIHPWEVDADQPRLDVPLLTRMRHYGGLRGTFARLERLLAEFRFTAIGETVRRL
ncbi:MAG TPA: XrtA system polysaccharide deacetylase [Gemmatimonadales bacterium]|nr:XrtA system polysaccharide deacetylase [Gemmatimonadales bacterium]